VQKYKIFQCKITILENIFVFLLLSSRSKTAAWAMLGKWLSKNPLKRKKNTDLDDFIYLRFDGMQETVNKAARNYKSTMAVCELDFILVNATKTNTDKPKSNRQEKFAKMLIMNANTPDYLPYFEKVKMLVSITKQKKDAKKIQYSITAIEPVE
jgi:hypothetical protein